MVSEKLCVFCPHFVWQAIEQEMSGCDTCGGWTEGGASCSKGHYGQNQDPFFSHDERPEDTDAFRALLLRAATCPDYAGPNK